jgi:hypothetical protein
VWSDVTKEGIDGIWKKTLKSIIQNLLQRWGACKNQYNSGWNAHNFILGLGEDAIEEFFEVIPEEPSNENLLELQ